MLTLFSIAYDCFAVFMVAKLREKLKKKRKNHELFINNVYF